MPSVGIARNVLPTHATWSAALIESKDERSDMMCSLSIRQLCCSVLKNSRNCASSVPRAMTTPFGPVLGTACAMGGRTNACVAARAAARHAAVADAACCSWCARVCPPSTQYRSMARCDGDESNECE